MAVAQGSKPTVKKPSAPKKASPRSSPSHPPYIQMITEALVALKERTGSSHYAIAKHIEEEQKVKELPSNFKKLLFTQLKKFVASGKLVKVKNSFKLPPKSSSSSPVADKPKSAPAKPKTAAKPKEAEKPKKKVAAKPTKPSKAKGKENVKPKPKAKAATGVKKTVPMKAKKPKSIKSPVKKAKTAAAAKTKKVVAGKKK